MDFDGERIYFSHQSIQQTNNTNDEDGFESTNNNSNNNNDTDGVDLNAVRRHFREFLRNYRQGQFTYKYRDLLLRMHRRCQGQSDGIRKIEIDLAHVGEYDSALLGLLLSQPDDVLPAMELAALDALHTLLYDQQQEQQQNNQLNETAMANNNDTIDANGETLQAQTNTKDFPTTSNIQILLKGNLATTPLRSIKSEHMNKLLKCPGIVISTSPIRSRATQIQLRCSRCLHSQRLLAEGGPFGSMAIPRRCAGPDPASCGPAPYGVVTDECHFVDRQTLKLQEAPEKVPTGEMPRSVLMAVERGLVDRAPPGTRVNVLCIPTLHSAGGGGGNGADSVRSLYLRIVGMSRENAPGESATFTEREEEAFRLLARRSDVYQILSRSIAPSISGSYTVDIKKAIVVMLMGGCRKKLPDGLRLRGDINVLLLGDPSTAKSQFLKFASRVAPVGIYTSGKGSSAAGLTASVVKDSRGEFFLEGGAMVLADGGIVAIDEFDKMRPADRVAIHEAMEQQTISIAKAGITTVLNTRSSVLAAANPVFGRYDDLKSAAENINLMTTILSRFDLIFLVRDIREDERDRDICRHVMGIHTSSSIESHGSGGAGGVGGGLSRNGGSAYGSTDGDGNDESGAGTFTTSSSTNANSAEAIVDNIMRIATSGVGELEVPAMKKYLQYAKAKCTPRLSDEAGDVLASSYVKIRDDVRKRTGGGRGGDEDGSTVIPITVRQLEALVRISESLAKMRLDSEVRAEDIAEALRLFRVSTMAASAADQQATATKVIPMGGGAASTGGTSILSGGGTHEEMQRTESFLRSRLAIGALVNKHRLVEEAASQGYNALVVGRAIAIMATRGEVQERNHSRLLKRIK